MILKNNPLPLIGYASGIAAGDIGCADGPLLLAQNNLVADLLAADVPTYWEAMLKPMQLPNKVLVVKEICQRLGELTKILVAAKQKFIVLAGDHSCAIGTWGGTAVACAEQGPLGLIWIDAHMDSHTFETTESGNIHGMPLAALLGYGAPELTQIMSAKPKLQPKNVSLIGVRSYERGEAALLETLGVRIYKMDEIAKRGINAVMSEAIKRAKHDTAGFGISLDLDGIDPIAAPGVGSPVINGLNATELCLALTELRHDKKLLGLEIAEFNPHHDVDNKTQMLIKKILQSVFG